MVEPCRTLLIYSRRLRSGDYIELTYDNIEEMIKVACEYPDYWDDYTNVPILCRMRDSFQEITEKGYHYYLEYDW